MHFFVIDPNIGTVMKVIGKPTLEQQYALIGCRLIDVVRLFTTTDVLIVDDEGLFLDQDKIRVSQQSEIQVTAYNSYTLAGPALYMGTSIEGESIEPEHTFQFYCVGPNGEGTWKHADESLTTVCRIECLNRVSNNYYKIPFILYGDMNFTFTEQTIEDAIILLAEERENKNHNDTKHL